MSNEELDLAEAKKLLSFQVSYNKRNIKATWAFALIIIGNFLLEEYFGGSQNTAVLVRMGANVSEQVILGEYYRLFTAVFLHAGWLHVFFNTYVLYALGGFFNRILGESRYVAVLLFSGLAGSLASVFLGKSAISVGASGAIWGLFGASLALSIFKTSLLPEPIRLSLRRITLINLLINLGISFLPMIDFWAHIGGGIGGFILGLAIVISSRDIKVYHLSSYFFRILSLILVLSYASAMIYGLWRYVPWQNPLKSSFVEISLPKTAFKVEAPSGLKLRDLSTSSSYHYIFGEPLLDGAAIELHFFRPEILGESLDKNWLRQKRDELLREKALTAEVKKTIYLKETVEGGILYYQQIPSNSNVLIHNYLITKDKYAVKVALLLDKSIKQSEADAIAEKLMRSLKLDQN